MLLRVEVEAILDASDIRDRLLEAMGGVLVRSEGDEGRGMVLIEVPIFYPDGRVEVVQEVLAISARG